MSNSRYIRIVIFGYPNQTKFAEVLEVNQSTLSRIEKNNAHFSVKMQQKLVSLAKEESVDFDANLFFRPLTKSEQAELAAMEVNQHESGLDPLPAPVMGKAKGNVPSDEVDISGVAV